MVVMVLLIVMSSPWWSTRRTHFCRNCDIVSQNHPQNATLRSPKAFPVATTRGKIYLKIRGRLGNELFMYAMLLSLGHNTSRPVYIISNNKTNLSLIFEGISVPTVKLTTKLAKKVNRLPVRKEIHSGIYTRNFASSLPYTDVEICCYFQSFKYFHFMRETIKKELVFRRQIRESVQNILRQASASHFGETNDEDIRYVGLHVRRGDVQDLKRYKKGYRVPKLSYYLKAKNYFMKRYTGPILFIVTTDNKEWVNRNLKASGTYISNATSASEDLALLAACNDTIMTLGTFGWWAGYLAGGKTVYYKNAIAKGSLLDRWTKLKDRYYKPDWIPMGDWDACYIIVSHDDAIKWKHFPRYWPFVRGIHRSRWISRTEASGAELWCFLWSQLELTVELTIVRLVISDAIAPIITSL